MLHRFVRSTVKTAPRPYWMVEEPCRCRCASSVVLKPIHLLCPASKDDGPHLGVFCRERRDATRDGARGTTRKPSRAGTRNGWRAPLLRVGRGLGRHLGRRSGRKLKKAERLARTLGPDLLKLVTWGMVSFPIRERPSGSPRAPRRKDRGTPYERFSAHLRVGHVVVTSRITVATGDPFCANQHIPSFTMSSSTV